jgi:hypothetical protein
MPLPLTFHIFFDTLYFFAAFFRHYWLAHFRWLRRWDSLLMLLILMMLIFIIVSFILIAIDDTLSSISRFATPFLHFDASPLMPDISPDW